MNPERAIKTGPRRTVLISEYEGEVRSYLMLALESRGYAVDTAEDGSDLLGYLRAAAQPPSAVLVDVAAPRLNGLETLREIRRHDPQLPVVLLSGPSSRLSVSEAMERGASGLLFKPIVHQQLCETMKAVLGDNWDVGAAEGPSGDGNGIEGLPAIGWMRDTETFVRRVGWADVPVLILGETGSGKEVLARRLHACSRRAQQPFLKLNCAALPSELVESELFGYDRGAFTGAFQKKAGMFELADGGTLLLDEIGDMDPKLQAKLLQVLQDQTFHHLGGRDTVRVNVRVVAATHRNLEAAIADGGFRADLYYRLNVLSISLPPLRERRKEIVPLAEYFLEKYAAPENPVKPLSPRLQEAMLHYDWPGNIRELENFMRRYAVLGDPESLNFELSRKVREVQRASSAVPAASGGEIFGTTNTSFLRRVRRVTEQVERDAIVSALDSTHWNRKQAAAILAIDYKTLLYKMKRLSLDGSSRRAAAAANKTD